MRRVSSLSIALSAAILSAGIGLAQASAGPPQQTGTFALLGGTPRVVSKFWATHANGLTSELNVAQYPIGSTAPILNYAVEMQRTMHMIVIRDDFATFDHLHPAFNTTTGAFIEKFTKEPNHRYYLYADSRPLNQPQQVFRFTLESDGPVAKASPSLAASLPTATVGPYSVVLEHTTLEANKPYAAEIEINENGHPAHDLGSYLGAASHVVFINTSTLQYVHVHPMAANAPSGNGPMKMNMTGTGPRQHLELPPLPAATYKMWMQFRGAKYKIYTVPFTIVVQ